MSELYFFLCADGDYSTTSTSESMKYLVTCACQNNESCKLGMQDGKETLESIWKKAIEICQSHSLKNFLKKKGKLSSICINQGTHIYALILS